MQVLVHLRLGVCVPLGVHTGFQRGNEPVPVWVVGEDLAGNLLQHCPPLGCSLPANLAQDITLDLGHSLIGGKALGNQNSSDSKSIHWKMHVCPCPSSVLAVKDLNLDRDLHHSLDVLVLVVFSPQDIVPSGMICLTLLNPELVWM